MKTPTLIVRLVGIYLVVKCGLSLVALSTLRSSPAVASGATSGFMSQMDFACWAGVILGACAVLQAGSLARLLTLDSEPGARKPDITDALLASPSKAGADLGKPGDGVSGEGVPRR